jgi:pimeloyl-ACP methyl ester carboxylesterase
MTELVEKPKNAPNSPRGRVHTIHYELSYLKQGTIDPAQPVVVLLHDFPGDATNWQPVLPALTRYPVLAFDMLGFGESERPWPADVSVWGHADALNLALRDMGLQQVILAGVGLGGGVAQVLATRLLAERVRGLALIDSEAYQYAFNANWPLTDMEKQQDPELPMHTPVDQFEAALRQTVPQASAKGLSGAALDALVKPWLSDLGKELFYQQIRKLVPYYLNAVADDLTHLTCPTLIIWGEKDTIFPQQWGVRLARNIPNAQLQVIPGAGHLILNDAPDQVAKLLSDFINFIKGM